MRNAQKRLLNGKQTKTVHTFVLLDTFLICKYEYMYIYCGFHRITYEPPSKNPVLPPLSLSLFSVGLKRRVPPSTWLRVVVQSSNGFDRSATLENHTGQNSCIFQLSKFFFIHANRSLRSARSFNRAVSS